MPENNNEYNLENSTTNESLDIDKEELEEQYRILKEEEEQEARRKSFLLIALFILIFIISFTSAVFSYMTYKKVLDNKNNLLEKENTSINDKTNGIKELVVIFDSGSEYIASLENSESKEFSVTNNGNLSADYSVVFTDIENTFSNVENLHYTLKYNGVTILADVPVPASEEVVLKKQTVDPGTKNDYEIFFKYVETDEAQNVDATNRYKLSIKVVETDEK